MSRWTAVCVLLCALTASQVASQVGPGLRQCLVRGEQITACAFARDGHSIFLSGKGDTKREIRHLKLPPDAAIPQDGVPFNDTEFVTKGINPLPFLDKLLFVRRGSKQGGVWVRDLAAGDEAQVRRDPFLGLPPAVSGDGKLIMVSRWAGRSKRIGIVDQTTGKYKSIPGKDMSQPALNEAGDRLLFVCGGHIWLRDLGSGEERQITTGQAVFSWPVWGPHGATIAFCARDPDGAGKVEVLDLHAARTVFSAEGLTEPICPALSPDGRWLIFIAKVGGEKADVLWRVPLRR